MTRGRMRDADLHRFITERFPGVRDLTAFYDQLTGKVTVQLGAHTHQFPADMFVSEGAMATVMEKAASDLIDKRKSALTKARIHPSAPHRRRFRAKANSIAAARRPTVKRVLVRLPGGYWP